MIKNTITVKPNSTDVEHLVWINSLVNYHNDLDERNITIIEGGGWKFQFKDEDEINLVEGVEINIPKGKFHRVIKGNSDLIFDIEIIIEGARYVDPVVEESTEPDTDSD